MMNQTLDPNNIELLHAAIRGGTPWAEFGVFCAILITLLGYFLLGFAAGKPGPIERKLIGRALREAKPPQDSILLEKWQKLLDTYRQKPGEKD